MVSAHTRWKRGTKCAVCIASKQHTVEQQRESWGSKRNEGAVERKNRTERDREERRGKQQRSRAFLPVVVHSGFWVYTVFRLAGGSVQRTRVYARVRSRVPRRARGCFAITYHYSAWLLQLQPRALFATRLPFVTLLPPTPTLSSLFFTPCFYPSTLWSVLCSLFFILGFLTHDLH